MVLTKRFLKELDSLPESIRNRAESVVFEELRCYMPFSLGYIEKMTGYADKYKIRIGSYRIGLTINKTEKLIVCQRIAHRKDIYNIFP